MLLHRKGKLTIAKSKSSHLSYSDVVSLPLESMLSKKKVGKSKEEKMLKLYNGQKKKTHKRNKKKKKKKKKPPNTVP
jgi:hypothetical protein